MFAIFRKPHPFIFNVHSISIPSTITFLIIVLFAPFQFQALGMNDRILIAGMISVLVALGIWIAVKGLKILFPNSISEDTWTVGKEFLLVLFVVVTIILLILIAFLIFQLSEVPLIPLFLKIASITLAISILPILVSILFEQYRHQKKQLKKATALTGFLKLRNEELLFKHAPKASAEQPILIKSENHEVELQLHPQALIYLKSDGNYVEVYFNDADTIQKKLVRNRLKAIEHILPNQVFFRCHNRFIVNGSYIIKVEGNARNLTLYIKGVAAQIPVSRTKAKAITSFLENLQK